jgi:hypothetical protein
MTTILRMPPITGPIRIDALTGHVPTWRPDHGEEPIYLGVVADLGPPGLLVGPADGALIRAEVTSC